jgi:serine/threonine-protein kinase
MGAPAPTAVLGGAPASTDELPASRPRAPVLGRLIGWAVVVALLLAAAGVALTLLADGDADPSRSRRREPGAAVQDATPTASPEPETVNVPSGLVGSNVGDAEGVLRDAGLEPRRQQVSSEEDQDTVVDAEPAEGTEVPAGSVVTLSVSTGPSPEPSPEDEGDDGDEEGPPGEGGEPPGQANKGGGKGGNGKGKGKDD